MTVKVVHVDTGVPKVSAAFLEALVLRIKLLQVHRRCLLELLVRKLYFFGFGGVSCINVS